MHKMNVRVVQERKRVRERGRVLYYRERERVRVLYYRERERERERARDLTILQATKGRTIKQVSKSNCIWL